MMLAEWSYPQTTAVALVCCVGYVGLLGLVLAGVNHWRVQHGKDPWP